VSILLLPSLYIMLEFDGYRSHLFEAILRFLRGKLEVAARGQIGRKQVKNRYQVLGIRY